ncbi:hypothetical protein LR007_00230 [candidate division NPL-UPA2 bacterium]|nr:hypothetical protein [candidate division NPL-UPA2 bacterium]
MYNAEEVAQRLHGENGQNFLTNDWSNSERFREIVNEINRDYLNRYTDRWYWEYMIGEIQLTEETLSLILCWKFYNLPNQKIHQLIWGPDRTRLQEIMRAIRRIRAYQPYAEQLQTGGALESEIKCSFGLEDSFVTQAFLFHLAHPKSYYLYDSNVVGCLNATEWYNEEGVNWQDLNCYLKPVDGPGRRSKFQVAIDGLVERYNSGLDLPEYERLIVLRRVDRLLWMVGKNLRNR